MSAARALDDADFDLGRVSDADGVAELARALYGEAFTPTPGVLHVTAIDGNTGRTLRIDERAPKSQADTFALNLTRARADAIIITGGILREEPALSYAPGAPGPESEALRAYRHHYGPSGPPRLVIMTRGAGLPLDHPVFHDGHTRPILYGPASGVLPLRQDTDAEVIGHTGDAHLGALLTLLRERGATTISVEAGPSTTRALYAGPVPLVDELCLSTYAGPPLEEAQLVGDPMRVPPELTLAQPEVLTRTASGPWRFGRYQRR